MRDPAHTGVKCQSCQHGYLVRYGEALDGRPVYRCTYCFVTITWGRDGL